MEKHFPVIDLSATGKNISRLRKERGLSVRDLQSWFGFEEPQAIYKWQWGKSLPSVDNLLALSALLEVPIDAILVTEPPRVHMAQHIHAVEAVTPATGATALPFLTVPHIQQKPMQRVLCLCIDFCFLCPGVLNTVGF